MLWSLNGDMEFSIENVVYYSSIDESKIDEFFDKKVRKYAENNLIDTRCFSIDPHFTKNTKDLEARLLKHITRFYWASIINFFNVKDINIHFGLDHFEQTKLTPKSLEKSVRYHSRKLINIDTAYKVEKIIKYLFEKPEFVKYDIMDAEQNDNYKNLTFVHNKMLIKPQNFVLNTEDYDYIDDFTPYVYKADIKNRTYTNSPTWNNQYFFYLDEYHKYMLYSYLYTVGGRAFKKYLKPLMQDYFPDQSIENVYNAGRQFICRNNMKKLTDMEQLYFKCEFEKLMFDYGKVWDKEKQQAAKECWLAENETTQEQDEVLLTTFSSRANCDISVKETQYNNYLKENNNILYNNIEEEDKINVITEWFGGGEQEIAFSY